MLEEIRATASQWELFARFLPYFTGRFSVEEIMWQENVARRDVADAMEAFEMVVKDLVY